MSRLAFTPNTPFPMDDWAQEDLVKIIAGAGCVMALTAQGDALQKIIRPSLTIRADYWYDLKDIAVSKTYVGMAIGLMRDGTCMISKRPLRSLIREHGQRLTDFDAINETVKNWKNIVQVACSDAFFALDDQGRVHHVGFTRGSDDYYEVSGWRDIVRIVPGATQHALFGITRSGNVVCAGHNCTRGPMGDIRSRTAELRDVVDLSTSGSECEQILFARKDGTLWRLGNPNVLIADSCAVTGQVLEGHFCASLIRQNNGTLSVQNYFFFETLTECARWQNVTAMALGDCNYDAPFALALID